MVAETHSDLADAVDGGQSPSNILGHQVGKVDCAPARRQLQGNDGMSVTNLERADESELQDRLIQFGVEHSPEPLQYDRAVAAVSEFAVGE